MPGRTSPQPSVWCRSEFRTRDTWATTRSYRICRECERDVRAVECSECRDLPIRSARREVLFRSCGLGENDQMFISSVDEGAAEGDLAEYYRSQHATWGFPPNYTAAFSTRTDVARAWNALNTTIRDGMDLRRFEIAAIATSRALRSTYCTEAH